jgi:hypothetical protein
MPTLSDFFALAFSGMAVLAWPFAVLAQQAHTPGQAQLGVAVNGGSLLLDLDAPLESLVGFEVAARTPRRREAMAMMKAQLKGDALWRPNPQAACTLLTGDVDVHRDGGHGHADVTASIAFECAKPEALRHLDIDLWRAFPNMKTVSVSVALPRVQFTRKLTREAVAADRVESRIGPSRLMLVPPKAR